MRVTVDDGVELAVEVLGDGPPFVMIHGFTGAKEDFADDAPRLAEHHQVVLFDHRGHGESDKPGDAAAYSLDRLAADTLAVADAVGADRFRLLGHSMGGMVAARIVEQHLARVERLVMMDTSPGPPGGVDPDLADLGADFALTEGMDALRALLDEVNPLNSAADQRVRAERPGYVEFNDRKWAAVPAIAYATLLRDIVHQPRQLDAMAAITCPTLVIVGEQDAAFIDDARAMTHTIPGANLVVIPDAGHSPQFENPSAWFAAVDGFLRALPAEVGV
jgi:pimeloyl-ACP methyl ester carboxylesterase